MKIRVEVVIQRPDNIPKVIYEWEGYSSDYGLIQEDGIREAIEEAEDED